jgi:hypothetical protein
LDERKRTLIAIAGIAGGLVVLAVGVVIAHFTNLPLEDIDGNEILPSIPRGWVLFTAGQIIALTGSQVMVAAAVYGFLWERPLTWARAGFGAFLGWIELVLFFGVIPSEMLNLAQGPLGWTAKPAFTIPKWLVLNNDVSISFKALKDFIVAGYYTNATFALFVAIYKAQEWIKDRREAPAVTQISAYGRPLSGRAR